jgi:putative ABC transport system permease protein
VRLAAASLRQMLRDLRGQKLRTLLTVLGIVWGTTAVSLLLAFGQGFHHQLLKDAAGLGTRIVITWPSRTSLPYEGLGKGRQIRLTESDMELLRARARGLGQVSLEYQQDLRLQRGRTTLAALTAGVEPQFGEMRNLIPEEGGRFLNPLDEELRRRVLFLGDELAEELFGEEEPVGRTLNLHGSPFLVVGVLKTKVQNSNYSGRDAGMAFIPASTFRALTGQRYLDNFIFTAEDLSLTGPLQDEVRRVLASRHRFDPEDEEALMIWDVTEMARFLDTFMLAFKLFLGIVGSLTLVVGGIGVSNIMNVVVEERTREIGIKMALGSRPRAILGQFLGETLAITAVGGLIGLALSALICAVFPALGLGEFVGDPTISPAVSGLTAALLGLIGLVAGYFPARGAANLDPVVAMKM